MVKSYNRESILDYNIKKTNIDDFVNKELIHFSNSDVSRSIGSSIDGLKTSQTFYSLALKENFIQRLE